MNGACVQVKVRFMGLFDTVLSYAVGSYISTIKWARLRLIVLFPFSYMG
jgi:hypothetical protein